MNKLYYSLLLGFGLLSYTSCMEIDNFDEPEASIKGRIIDDTTGEPYQGCVGDNHIKIWEMSFSTNPGEQGLHIKSDGTYVNNKLFAGTYDMCPVDGPWFPVDTIRDVKIGNGGATQDFHVVPYLKIKDFEANLEIYPDATMDTLVVSGRLFAPYPDGYNGTELPQIREVRPFVSLNDICGASSMLGFYYSDDLRANIRKAWSRIGDPETGEGNETYTFRIPVKPGYHYWVRMGANVNDQYQHWNYSAVKDIDVPQR